MEIGPLEIDRSKLKLQSLSQREHLISRNSFLPLAEVNNIPKQIKDVAERVIRARNSGTHVILMMGAHVLRSGVQKFLIDMMKDGYISCIATNGACVIHDYEIALIGETTESVARYIKDGRFGFWEETGRINEIVNEAAQKGKGLGEAIGEAINNGNFPYHDISIFSSAYRLGVQTTVHVGIGYDITHQHPNCDGAAYGASSYTDFLRFTKVLEKLEGGVVMVFGSSVMAPEVFLKSLSMARNIARQEGRQIRDFTTMVCDLQPLPDDFRVEPSKDMPQYYFRPWKTLLVRTVQDGGKSYYVQGHHSETIPALWTAIKQAQG